MPDKKSITELMKAAGDDPELAAKFADAATTDEVVAFGPYRLDLATRTFKRNDETLALTTGEFALLKVLVQHPRTPMSRDKLMELARGREAGAFDRSIDVQVSRLRKLIEADPAKPAYIQTVWGFGYVFIPDKPVNGEQ